MGPPDSADRRRGTLHVTVVSRGARRQGAGLARWLEGAAPPRTDGEVTIALVSDRKIRELNRMFRQKEGVTDVLSFPAESRRPGIARRPRRAQPATPITEPAPYLGDLAIAVGVARRQAAAFGHPLGTELRVLALHGLLHLLGYDHERDGGAMHRLENRLRRRAGLPAGLIARASRPRRASR